MKNHVLNHTSQCIIHSVNLMMSNSEYIFHISDIIIKKTVRERLLQ